MGYPAKQRQSMPRGLARNPVLETMKSATEMGRDRPELPLPAMVEELVTRQTLECIEERQAMSADGGPGSSPPRRTRGQSSTTERRRQLHASLYVLRKPRA